MHANGEDDVDKDAGRRRESMHPRLAQCFLVMPDLEYVKRAIDTWFEHELVATRSFVTAEEMNDLYDRVCDMNASATELAFLYTFLVAAGAASLTNTANLDKRMVDELYSLKAARRFIGIVFELLALVQQQEVEQAMAGMHDKSDTHVGPGQAAEHSFYDWRNLSRCPKPLLGCRLHSMLCCFFHQARDPQRSMTHGNRAICLARKYGLYEQLQQAERPSDTPSTSSYAKHIYALRRLQFDLTVYPRLAITNDGTSTGKCVLRPHEGCQDAKQIAISSDGVSLAPLAYDYQCLKLVLSEIRAAALQHAAAPGRRPPGNASDDPECSTDLHGADRQDAADWALANDDIVLGLMKKLPSWVQVDARSNWFHVSNVKVMDATSIVNMLWARYACNRLRTENLLQMCNVYMTPELQGRALAAAQDTLFLIGKVRHLLRTPFQFAAARDWLYLESEWSLNVFNRIIEAEISQEIQAPVQRQASQSNTRTISPGCETFAVTSTPATPTVSTSKTSSPARSTACPSPMSSSSVCATPSLAKAHLPSTEHGGPRRSDVHDNDDKAIAAHANSSIVSAPISAHLTSVFAAKAREKTYRYFAWFIFGFKDIQQTLQDLHCFGPSLFEASRMLLRLQVPRPPDMDDKLKMFAAMRQQAERRGALVKGAVGTGAAPSTVSTTHVSSTGSKRIRRVHGGVKEQGP